MTESSTHAHPAGFASQFGGLWTDLGNAEDLIAERLALGDITQDEATLLHCWIKDGYVILEGAVSHQVVDDVTRDIDNLYACGIGFAETFEDGIHLVPLEGRHRTIPHKLIDGYASCPNIRKAMMSERVVRFMNIIFNGPALAFQGLYFEYGSEQAMHQDSAFVRVNRPMELAASWLALEDIKPNSGELEYYPGSHRIPEFIFEDNSKWLPTDGRQYEAFIKYLDEECIRSGLTKKRFAAKKGDVLIWSAGLVHGGSPIEDRTTRRSFVTHWCPATAEPSYFAHTHHSGRIKHSELASYAYSYHGRKSDPYREAEDTNDANAGTTKKRSWFRWPW